MADGGDGRFGRWTLVRIDNAGGPSASDGRRQWASPWMDGAAPTRASTRSAADARRVPAARRGPCPWVPCKHHLYLDVNDRTGSVKINFPDLEVGSWPSRARLDVGRSWRRHPGGAWASI